MSNRRHTTQRDRPQFAKMGFNCASKATAIFLLLSVSALGNYLWDLFRSNHWQLSSFWSIYSHSRLSSLAVSAKKSGDVKELQIGVKVTNHPSLTNSVASTDFSSRVLNIRKTLRLTEVPLIEHFKCIIWVFFLSYFLIFWISFFIYIISVQARNLWSSGSQGR